ncbi:hypothetical protein KP509_18G079200 [Ceratopteris richardii]|nr:hypothetical protein KP509_18G079200 [Ceratopteris richardii]
MFYGPGGPYALFAGKDASRALAKMSFEEQDLNGNLEGLGAYEMDALQDWEWKFIGKYEKVGQIVKKVSELREVPVVSKDEEANSRDIDTTVTEAKDIDTTAAREAEDSVKVDKESEKQVTSEDAKESKEGNEEKVSEEPEKTIAKEETATTE